MAISQYWVGQIPSQPISITVYDSYGYPKNLSAYPEISALMVGSDNEDIDLTGAVVLTSGGSQGRLVFRLPSDRSVFDKPGEYLLQLELKGIEGSKDFTSTHTIRVKRLGGVY